MEAEVRTLRLRTGISVPCLVQGDPASPPVLLLHAWGESRGSFDRLLPGLSGFRVHAPDLRGQGGADKPEGGYSLAVQDGTRIPSNAWKQIMSGLVAAPPPTGSGTIRSPALILWGAEDNVLPREDQETLAAHIDGSVLKVYPGVGHLVLWEVPEQVAEDAAAFFRHHSGGPAPEPPP
ncbi:alpha/beta hydrolase [Arthrobacter sp. Sa2CUA1]|uniref:Alpha/beta hydrolase n=1 Tax=Arthrobacter gallicola TaxID=2762225 RepID=A0ABR8UUL0_9MICC|nr:alpha/beta hydrolase [Arthrobacter gallicola]MBD7996250.1 alpha/beta hydrolase [Arthrobacter gallicola]